MKTRRRIYIIPTLFGATYGLALFMMLLMAYTYQNNLAYALTFFLVAFAVAGMFATHRVLEKLEWETRKPGLLIEGEDFAAPFSFGDAEVPATAVTARPLSLPAIAADDDGAWRARRRGVHELKRVEVRTTFPAGFFRAWTRLDVAMTLLVAPAPRDFGLRPGGLDDADQEGASARRPGEPEELQGLEPARDEEPTSRIDWPALARGRGLLRKDFDEASRPETVLRWRDTEPLNDPEKRLGQMSAWILGARDRLRVQGPSGTWFQRRDEALEDLARYPAGSP